MKKQIEEYIPKALIAIEELKLAKDGEIPKQFNGYISAFGASIRQAGLHMTILFYANENANSEEKRAEIIKIIEKIIGQSIIGSNHKVEKTLRAKVEDAAVALKLAIRTYKLVEKKA